MITKIYFETFAPGMKARLDPAYRQVNKTRGRHNIILTPKTETRSNRNAFGSLAKLRKSF